MMMMMLCAQERRGGDGSCSPFNPHCAREREIHTAVRLASAYPHEQVPDILRRCVQVLRFSRCCPAHSPPLSC